MLSIGSVEFMKVFGFYTWIMILEFKGEKVRGQVISENRYLT